ncbi:MAG: type II secretion system protein GspC, partial [Thiothrix sp.]
VLVILCGFLLARLVWLLFPAEPRPVQRQDADPEFSSAPAAPTQNFGEQLASLHLFGQYQADVADKPVTSNVQPTQLALKLRGTYAPARGQGFAIIEANGQQKTYALGGEIDTLGVVLESVQADHVLLRRNGVLEKLALPDPKLAGGDTAGMVMDGEMPLDMPPPEMLAPPDMFIPSEGAVPPATETETASLMPAEEPIPSEAAEVNLREFRQAVMQNNMRLLEVVSPQPYERDGKFLGFQLSPGSNVAVFNQLGFQAGDIVTAINGTVLDSPATAMHALQEAASATQVGLTIIRNGQELNLPVNFQ